MIAEFNEGNATNSFDFKAKITGPTGANGRRNVEIMVLLKTLSNFWRILEMPLINCEVNLIIILNEGATFAITETKISVPVVTLSTQNSAKLLQQLKSGFKIIINWNTYLSKKELLAQNPSLNDLVDPNFQGVNRLFVSAFENNVQRTTNKRYYLPNVEIKD